MYLLNIIVEALVPHTFTRWVNTRSQNEHNSFYIKYVLLTLKLNVLIFIACFQSELISNSIKNCLKTSCERFKSLYYNCTKNNIYSFHVVLKRNKK